MAKAEAFFVKLWNSKRTDHATPLLSFLFLCSLFYGMIIRCRNLFFRLGLFRTYRLNRPVISIGNITVGGTGKTPAVLHISSMLQDKGFHPAILSRGYGGKERAPVTVVTTGKDILTGPDMAGDEPCMMAACSHGVPVLTGCKRALTGQH